MEKVKHSTEVMILGQRYAMKSEYDPAFVAETAELVNSHMRRIMDRTSTISSIKVAVLAAMNIAGEYLKIKRERDELKKEVEIRTGNVIRIIDEQLEAGL